jgi:transglutaminase-like putative cysteine protease
MAVFFSCTPKIPVIHSIYPQIGRMGETLTIRGAHFGKEQDESYVTIAGAAPTNSAYINWQDDQIALTLPEFGKSGLVYVHAKGLKSNGVLFSNQATLPKTAQREDADIWPHIASVSPQSGAPGSLVVISGGNFGASREDGGVFFSWDAELSAAAPEETKTPAFVAVSQAEAGYELWSEREIRVRVPDGAISGSMEVRTPRGTSLPFLFTIDGMPGTKTFRDKRSYTISYSVNVKINEASVPNTLYLWIPQPLISTAQRSAELLSRSMEPFVDNYQGASLFKLGNLSAHSQTRIDLAYKVEVYAVETLVRPQLLRQEAVSGLYTQSSPLIPAAKPEIKKQANALVGRERNPYLKARRVYEWMLSEGLIQETASAGGVIDALNAKRADPYTAALLYCALLRSAGVPCVPVAGVLVNRSRETIRHVWAEFWIDGFGWVPVDPAMGAGAVPASFSSRPDRATFYLGSVDSQRIAFSRGETSFSPMEPKGRPITHIRSYALQNLWEEATGDIESYSSLWGDITITGTYVQ